jgi:hypothetical protein
VAAVIKATVGLTPATIGLRTASSTTFGLIPLFFERLGLREDF